MGFGPTPDAWLAANLCCEEPIQERIREEIRLVILLQSINLKFPVVLIVATDGKRLADMIAELRLQNQINLRHWTR